MPLHSALKNAYPKEIAESIFIRSANLSKSGKIYLQLDSSKQRASILAANKDRIRRCVHLTLLLALSGLKCCCQFSDTDQHVWVNPLLSEAMEKKKAEDRAKQRQLKKAVE